MSLAGTPATSRFRHHLVEARLRGCGSTWKRVDLDERVALACSGRDLEVRGIVFDEPLSAIIVRDLERLDEGRMNSFEDLLLIDGSASVDDLDPL
jgi:hypothetical protein